MIGDVGPYPAYKKSGLSWLGEMPSHWRLLRNGNLFGQRTQTGFADLPILEVSLKTGVRVRRFGATGRKQILSDLAKYKRAAAGDLAYNTMRMWQGALGVCPIDGLVSPAYVVARPYANVEPRFFAELFRTATYLAEIDSASRGIVKDRNRLYWEQFKQMQVLVPPPEEQAAIVRFLDWANGRLVRAIRAKRKVIALLDEQKQAIIHRAVTRGLDPSVPLKPSGIAWLGSVPRHWELRRLRTLVHRIEQGVSPQATGFLAEGDSWGVLKSGCVNHGVFRQTEHKQLATTFAIDPGIVVKVGDVLISRACGSPRLVGSVGMVEALDYKLILSDKTFRAVFKPSVSREFMAYAMNSSYYRQQVERAISGAEGMANNLPLSELRSFVLAVPPIAEAEAIAASVKSELARFVTSVSRLEAEIDLLREYHTRLIADVVTGQLDVREAAARLPDESGADAADGEVGDASEEVAEEEAPS